MLEQEKRTETTTATAAAGTTATATGTPVAASAGETSHGYERLTRGHSQNRAGFGGTIAEASGLGRDNSETERPSGGQ